MPRFQNKIVTILNARKQTSHLQVIVGFSQVVFVIFLNIFTLNIGQNDSQFDEHIFSSGLKLETNHLQAVYHAHVLNWWAPSAAHNFTKIGVK